MLKETNNQLFISFVNEPTFTGSFGGQLKRLYDLLKQRPVTCEDAQTLGIAGSAYARRIKDLRDNYNIRISISKVKYKRIFDGKEVSISQYTLVK